LSVGSVVALTSVVGAVTLVKGNSALTAACLTIAVGGLIGLVNGLIIGGLRMMPFIVTLGMMGIARGTAKWLSGSQTVNTPENKINDIMDPTGGALHEACGITLSLAILMALVMRGTVFGRYVFAIGANEAAARLSGIRVRLQKSHDLYFGRAVFWHCWLDATFAIDARRIRLWPSDWSWIL